MSRVIYYGGGGSGRPNGGFGVLLQHVRWLRDAGFDSRLQVLPGFRSEFEAVPADWLLPVAEPLEPGDHLVYPETDLRVVPAGRTATRWLFCQNHHFIFNTTPSSGDWSALNLAGLLAGSRTIQRFVDRHFPEIPSTHLPCAIDEGYFQGGRGPRAPTIAVMPRKMPGEAKFIRGSFERRFPELVAIPWIEIDRMQRPEVAACLARASIFLALGKTEGLGLPPLEAMASGAMVVGFAGGGVEDYATAENGLWSMPGEFEELVNNLALAVLLSRDGFAQFARYRQAGLRTARRYREEKARGAVLAFWRRQMGV